MLTMAGQGADTTALHDSFHLRPCGITYAMQTLLFWEEYVVCVREKPLFQLQFLEGVRLIFLLGTGGKSIIPHN